MKKANRLLSLLLAVVLTAGLLTVSGGAATSERETKAQVLSALGLFKGYDDTGTNFGLSNGATREHAILFLIRMLGEEKAAAAWTGAQPYSDVPSSSYYYSYIGYAKAKGYTNGLGNNKFGLPQENSCAGASLCCNFHLAKRQFLRCKSENEAAAFWEKPHWTGGAPPGFRHAAPFA